MTQPEYFTVFATAAVTYQHPTHLLAVVTGYAG
jgi:hypothetical protein